jgi:hypothetical protein
MEPPLLGFEHNLLALPPFGCALLFRVSKNREIGFPLARMPPSLRFFVLVTPATDVT